MSLPSLLIITQLLSVICCQMFYSDIPSTQSFHYKEERAILMRNRAVEVDFVKEELLVPTAPQQRLELLEDEYGLKYDDYEPDNTITVTTEVPDFDELGRELEIVATKAMNSVNDVEWNPWMDANVDGDTVDEPKCGGIHTGISFFVPHNAINTRIFGSRRPLRNACDICENGTQHSYLPVEDDFDVIEPENSIPNIPIGTFICPNNRMCIEDRRGHHWFPSPEAAQITLIPVPRCHKGECGVWMLFATSKHLHNDDSLDLISNEAGLGMRAEDLQSGFGFRRQQDYDYVHIRGFHCAPCNTQKKFCF